VRRYWEPRYRGVERRPRGEVVEMLRAELTAAVDRRIDAGSTAVLLSGGLDSACIAGMARRFVAPQRRPASAYSAVFPAHPEADESSYVDAIADELGLESVRLEVHGGSLFPGVAEYFRRWALPPTSPNLFFWLPLFRRASELGVDVLLDGEGGDQVFSLSPYLIADRLRRGRMLSALRLARRMPGAGPNPPWYSVRDKLVNVGARGALPVAVQRLRRRRSAGDRYTPAWFRPQTALAYVRSDDQWRWRGLDGPLWWAWLVDQTLGGIGPALTLDHVRQRAAMEGVAVRHPLLDVDLIESVLRIDPELAFDWRHSRPLLREALDGVLPDPVRLRPGKATFDAVFHEALLGRDMPLVRRLLLDPSARVREYLDQDVLRDRLLDLPPEQYPGGVIWWALPVWRTASLECFLRGIEDPRALEELCLAAT
jgi:asparagine synthase (glutamine-hydrolysing)